MHQPHYDSDDELPRPNGDASADGAGGDLSTNNNANENRLGDPKRYYFDYADLNDPLKFHVPEEQRDLKPELS